MTASHFRELEVWQLAMKLAKEVYLVCSQFPREERYGLTSQLQRSAVSIPSNIADGNARGSTRDYARFICIAQGSCAELQTQLPLARDLQMASPVDLDISLELCDRVGQMLRRLNQSLSRRMNIQSSDAI